jgi:hypothetical protein
LTLGSDRKRWSAIAFVEVFSRVLMALLDA